MHHIEEVHVCYCPYIDSCHWNLFSKLLQALLSELKTTEPWTSQHISDHSGFHYRQFLLSELHSRHCQLAMMYQQNSTQLFIFELSVICELIQSFPGHEALWYHRFVSLFHRFMFLYHSFMSLNHRFMSLYHRSVSLNHRFMSLNHRLVFVK